MSELKVHRFITTDELFPEANAGVLYYEKSEADKVIAEKDAEIARLKAIRKVHVEAIESMGAGLLQDEKEIRHQKYKRCLAMVRWCNFWANYWECCQPSDCGMFIARAKFFRKWHRRWLELAEKFKEAK